MIWTRNKSFFLRALKFEVIIMLYYETKFEFRIVNHELVHTIFLWQLVYKGWMNVNLLKGELISLFMKATSTCFKSHFQRSTDETCSYTCSKHVKDIIQNETVRVTLVWYVNFLPRLIRWWKLAAWNSWHSTTSLINLIFFVSELLGGEWLDDATHRWECFLL